MTTVSYVGLPLIQRIQLSRNHWRAPRREYYTVWLEYYSNERPLAIDLNKGELYLFELGEKIPAKLLNALSH